jgi:hypothetical protein
VFKYLNYSLSVTALSILRQIRTIVCLVLLLTAVPYTYSQTSVLSGIVSDETGAVLPDTKVTVIKTETGRSRLLHTDQEGRYTAPDLEPGQYEVRAELQGFQKLVRTGILLALGQSAALDLKLQVGQLDQKVEVNGDLVQVETGNATVKGTVDPRMIRDLPLNGRDFSQLATLQAGVYANPTMGRAITAAQGAGPRISISGSRPNQNSFLLDGSDVQDAQQRTPAGVSGTTLGVETVREFAVLVNVYSAEYGGRAGGVINAVTKSGTKQLHGSLFEFLRNDNLDARNFFDVAKPEFKRNQYGFTLGGPIRGDRTFFFGSFEGLRDRLGTTRLSTTLTAAGRQGILGNRVLTVNPAVKPYAELFPLPNGRDFGDGRGEYISTVRTPTDEDYYLLKLDHNLSDTDTLSGRYILDRSSTFSSNAFPGFGNSGTTRRQFFTLQEKKVIGSRLFNEFQVSFNRNAVGSVSDQSINLPSSLSFVQGRPFGSLVVSGLSGFGYARLSDRQLTQNLFEYRDTLSYTRGRHLLRFGGRWQRIQFNTVSAFAQNAEWTFTSIDNFFANKPQSLDVMDPRSDRIRGWRLNSASAFVQDDWKVASRLTLNLGLRYELTTEPWEVNGKAASLLHPDTDTSVTVVKTLYHNPSRKNFGPRVGFGWDVLGNGKTALRGGFGIYHNLILPVDWIFAGTNLPPFFIRPTLTNPTGFPSASAALAAAAPTPFLNALTADPRQPYVYKYSLSLQRELFNDLLISIGYAGARGVHLGREQMVNIYNFQVLPDGRKFFPAASVRRNPKFGAISYTTFDTNSLYNALQVSALKRFSHRYQFQFNYTYAQALDATDGNIGTSEVGGGTTGSLDPFDWKRDWGPASFDVRNKATATFTYDLPRFSGRSGALWGAWQFNGILTLADGVPNNILMSVDVSRSGILAPSGGHLRPDLKPAGNSNPVTNSRNPDHYWDGSQFQLPQAGFLGNLGRNTGTIPGLATLDLSVNKNFLFWEGRSLQFRVEGFNVLNRANFGAPNSAVFTNATGVPSSTFGRITSTTTTSRQLQFGLKFIF